MDHVENGRGTPRESSRGEVGLGLFVGFLAAVLCAFAPFAALGLTVLALVLWLHAARRSLRRSGPAPELGRDATTLKEQLAVALDLALLLKFWFDGRFRPDGDVAGVAADVRAAAAIATPSLPRVFAPLAPRVERRGHGREELSYASPGASDGHVQLRRHGDRPRPTVICIHGYRMGWPRLDRAAFRARGLDVEAWYQRGFDIAFFVLPLHGPRSYGWGSGNGFLDGHPLATRDALLRAVAELGSLCAWLHDQGSSALAVTGISLGGLVTSLAASSIPGLRAAIPVMPAVRIGELVWSEARASYRRKAEAAGLDLETIEQAWAAVDPLRLTPLVPRDGLLILAGALDRIVPPEQPRALWRHWGEPRILWFAGTHMSSLDRARVRMVVEEHLSATLQI